MSISINDELIKKVEEQGFNRQDYSHEDMLEILSYGDYDEKYVKLIEKMVDAITPEDVEALYNISYARNDVFPNRVFTKMSYVTPEIKSKLLDKCNKLILFAKNDGKMDQYSTAILKAYNNASKLNEKDIFGHLISESCSGIKYRIYDNLNNITATPELVEYITEVEGNGSPLIFLREPYKLLKGWQSFLSEENKKFIRSIQTLTLASKRWQIEEFFEDAGPVLSKNRNCYNSIVNYIKDNITIDFKKAYQDFSDSPPYIQTDKLAELINKYNEFMQTFNEQIKPYQENFDKTKSKQENL